jgi:hypothetical protein
LRKGRAMALVSVSGSRECYRAFALSQGASFATVQVRSLWISQPQSFGYTAAEDALPTRCSRLPRRVPQIHYRPAALLSDETAKTCSTDALRPTRASVGGCLRLPGMERCFIDVV